MNTISLVEAELPPGFRFHPRDDELVCDYLSRKITNSDTLLLLEVDLNKCEPWDIPQSACVGGKDWYFYSQRDRKYATGLRTNRATASGYWKATGKDRSVCRKGRLVGMRKTLVFYQGRAPKGRKTDWVMHEFRLEGHSPKLSSLKEDWVLCKVFYKNREVVCGHGQAGGGASMGSCYDVTDSSFLPPLMDSYISFDQTQPNNLGDFYKDNNNNIDHQQVPCFSLFSHNNNNNNNSSSNIHHHDQDHQANNPIFSHINQLPNIINTPTSTNMFGQVPFGSAFLDPSAALTSCSSSTSGDNKKVIKAVLNHYFNKLESSSSTPPPTMMTMKGSSSSLGDQPSSDSYLSEVGMIPNSMWNNRY